MDRYGSIVETIGRFAARVAFSAISFVIAFAVALALVHVLRIVLGSISGHPLDTEVIHPIYAPFWLALGMWSMRRFGE